MDPGGCGTTIGTVGEGAPGPFSFVGGRVLHLGPLIVGFVEAGRHVSGGSAQR